MAHARLTFPQFVQDAQPGLVGKDMEQLGCLLIQILPHYTFLTTFIVLHIILRKTISVKLAMITSAMTLNR